MEVVAIILSIIEGGASLLIFKIYQLSGYKLKRFWKDLKKLNFKNKTPLKFTPRILRLFGTFFCFLVAFNLVYFILATAPWLYGIYVLVFIFAFAVIFLLACTCMWPIEHLIALSYIKRAQKKLKNVNCIKIGITGSFGKTSTKDILKEMLSYKYKICASPKSYNTPLGLSRTVLENLKSDDEIIIFEMGAKNIGDIDYLCKIYGVDYGVITSVGRQHLETFKSLSRIEDTKFELYKNTKKLTVFGSGLKETLYRRAGENKVLVGEKGSICYALDVKYSRSGMEAKVVLSDHELSLKTRLLGQLNLNNIMCALALSHILGVPTYDLKKAVENLRPTPHRLELISTENLMIIDDSYNSNELGAMEALNVLKLFDGKKFIITPGIVEMGSEQESVNFKFGEEIASVCDYVVIMNLENKEAILGGLKKAGFGEDKIFFKSKLEGAMEVIKANSKPGDIILFENDLPDNFK